MIKPSNRRPAVASLRFASGAALVCLCGVLPVLFTGCLSRPALVRQNFALASPAPTSEPTVPGNHILALRFCTVSPLFENRAFSYRIGPDAYEQDPYAGFLVSPGHALAIPIRDYLRNSGAYQDVADPGSLLAADRWLEVYVSELYADFQTPGHPAAVLTMRFVFFRSNDGKPSSVVLDQRYSRRIPLTENTATSVVAGWNQALAEIMTEVSANLAARP